MFSTLGSMWDQPARRGWWTIASFGFQAMALSFLLLVPLLWVQGPPRVAWFRMRDFFVPPAAPAPTPSGQPHTTAHPTNLNSVQIVQPGSIPPEIAQVDERQIGSAPNIDDGGVIGATGISLGVWHAVRPTVEVAPPPTAPAAARPLRISHWAEGNLIHRVQPAYPPLARLAHIQGPVRLRAIISKAGTIENLVAISGHPLLVPAAIDAVRQWRYRPYLLNDQPITIETEITVNFILAGN